MQPDAEPVEKEMINEAYTLLTAGKAQRFVQDTDTPLHDESVIAVRNEFLDVSDEKVSGEGDCLSRSMTIQALHVRLTPETKESINEVCV